MTTLSIDVAMLLLLTSLTGAIMVLLWYFIGLILESMGFANIVFELLKMVVVFFLLPIAWIVLETSGLDIGKGHLFSPTPVIMNFTNKFVQLWIIGAGVFMLIILLDIFRVHYRYQDAFPCRIGAHTIFDELKCKMGLETSPLQLRQSYRTKTPCLVGMWKPRIVLPVEEYTDGELRVILAHEMSHYKQKDIILKHMAYIMLSFHYINPFAWILFFKIQKWSEFACDLAAYKFAGGIKEYFEVILRVTMDNPLKSGLTSHLANNQHELMERVRKLMRISKMKKRSRSSVVLVLITAFMLSSTSVYAASVECAEAYVNMENRTAVEATEASNPSSGYVEYWDTDDSEGITIVEGESSDVNTRGAYTFDWDVPAGYRVYSGYFDLEDNGQVMVMVSLDPTNVNTRIGIEFPDGSRRYVEGTDSIYHTFNVASGGRFRIYAQNDTSTDVSAIGSYIPR